ncbi:hypothetical protein [Acinetobacter ursingii]|uniref:hypothetical protein n=1 Tax=Acinetobacter ursingii TaxID=108980 RepID=UPI001250695F|nr:hypothetical protein [Acinetobacter ursingii]
MIDLNLQALKLEGTPEEVAEQIFQKFVGPMFDHLKKNDPEMALRFGFCVAGNANACYMNSCSDVEKARSLICESTNLMAADIKLSRKKVKRS